ncbi:MAG TPA: dTMP kinase [Spirochaetia bacterium]|nr:MAG: dTMP kinase [Spirochaetes bacterium GWB1_36_13]HCL55811.1 dTMP kinase [Spirochaetia bacterium]
MSRLIVFEGIDGAGTTTQSRLLFEALNKGKKAFWDKEPTDGEIGKMIRDILFNHLEVHPLTFLQLFLADRAHHQEIIKDRLASSHDFILDRYILSTMAYQGEIFEIEDLYQLNKNFQIPDIVFFIDVPVKTGLSRKTGKKELFEKEEILIKVRERYLKSIDYLKNKNWNIIMLDGEKTQDELHKEILNYID